MADFHGKSNLLFSNFGLLLFGTYSPACHFSSLCLRFLSSSLSSFSFFFILLSFIPPALLLRFSSSPLPLLWIICYPYTLLSTSGNVYHQLTLVEAHGKKKRKEGPKTFLKDLLLDPFLDPTFGSILCLLIVVCPSFSRFLLFAHVATISMPMLY